MDYTAWASDLATKARARSYGDALRETQEKLAEFEKRHGFASDELQGAIASGRISRHDRDACTWALLIQRRDRLAKRVRASR